MTTLTTATTAALFIAERLWFAAVELEHNEPDATNDPEMLRTISVELRRAVRLAERGKAAQYDKALTEVWLLSASINNPICRRKAQSQIVALRSM